MVSPMRSAGSVRIEDRNAESEKMEQSRAQWIQAMDVSGMKRQLGGALFHEPGQEFDLGIRRAFPGARTGQGVVEYEIAWRASRSGPLGRRIAYGRFNRDSKSRFQDPITINDSPASAAERDDFLLGRRALATREPDMSLSVFPLDDRMPWLEGLQDQDMITARLQPELRRLFGKEKTALLEGPEVLGYRFGKRSTLRYYLTVIEGDKKEIIRRTPIIGKVYHDERGRGIFSNIEQLWNWSVNVRRARPPIFPRPIGYLPDLRVGFHEAMEGKGLFDIEDEPMRNKVIERTAELLSAFHDSGLVVEGRYLPEDEYSLLERSLESLDILFPEYRTRGRQVIDRIREVGNAAGTSGFVRSITHRDFYDKQVIAGPAGLSLIDLDTVTMSDPALDVGNFLAHLHLRALQGRLSIPGSRREASLFESTYRRCSPGVDKTRVAFYQATSLFRLACLYAFRPIWKGVCDPLLEECERRLAETEDICAGSGRRGL